jgi:RND family efflux transporter MFP subunit
MKRGRLIAGGIAVAVLAAIGGGYAFSQANAKTTITTATAASQDLSVTVSAPGTVDAAARTSVYSPVAGTLTAVKVTDGQAVKAGDVLATLDDSPLATALAQAKATVALADAQSNAASAQLAQAKAQRAAARAMPHDTDAQSSARTAATEAADAAASAASASQDAAGAAQSAAAAALKTTEANAAKASITAPVDGTVTFPVLAITSLDGTGPKAAAGASVSTATPIFTIVDLTKVVFAAQVDEADIAGVKAGATASVTLDAFPGRPFEGTVSEIGTSSVTTKTGGIAYLVKVPLTPGDAVLRLGLSGDVALATQNVAGALVVPAQAVQSDGAKHYVFKVAAGKVVRVEVAVGASTDTLTQITSGLAAGDVVATSLLGSLKDGASVNVAG